jgi:hypothetical protein
VFEDEDYHPEQSEGDHERLPRPQERTVGRRIANEWLIRPVLSPGCIHVGPARHGGDRRVNNEVRCLARLGIGETVGAGVAFLEIVGQDEVRNFILQLPDAGGDRRRNGHVTFPQLQSLQSKLHFMLNTCLVAKI